MAIRLTRLTLFVSGTSEADAERAALQSVADRISRLLEKSNAVTIRVSAEPQSIRPGIEIDARAEIERQLAEIAYDIYLGLVGSQFGTAMRRAGSGTDAEFGVVLTRLRANMKAARVLFYFNHALADPFKVDPGQLQMVKDFCDSLDKQGVFYRKFGSTAEFSELVREDLHHLVLNEWEDQSWKD